MFMSLARYVTEDDHPHPSTSSLLSCLYEHDTLAPRILHGHKRTLSTHDAAAKIQATFRMHHQRMWYIEYVKRYVCMCDTAW